MSSKTSDRSFNRPGLVIPDANFSSNQRRQVEISHPVLFDTDGPGIGGRQQVFSFTVTRVFPRGEELDANSEVLCPSSVLLCLWGGRYPSPLQFLSCTFFKSPLVTRMSNILG